MIQAIGDPYSFLFILVPYGNNNAQEGISKPHMLAGVGIVTITINKLGGGFNSLLVAPGSLGK